MPVSSFSLHSIPVREDEPAIEVLQVLLSLQWYIACKSPRPMFHNILNSQFYGGEYTNVEGNLNFHTNSNIYQLVLSDDTAIRRLEGALKIGLYHVSIT